VHALLGRLLAVVVLDLFEIDIDDFVVGARLG
jgi:hypothetical protein